MVGLTERGPIAARLVTSWLEYERWFGGHVEGVSRSSPTPSRATSTTADNGCSSRGSRARRGRRNPRPRTADAAQDLQIAAIGPGAWGEQPLRPRPGRRQPESRRQRVPDHGPLLPGRSAAAAGRSARPRQRGRPQPARARRDRGLRAARRRSVGPGYVLTTVNAASRLVQARWSDDTVAPNRPNNVGFTQLQNGADGANAVTAARVRGDPTAPTDRRSRAGGPRGHRRDRAAGGPRRGPPRLPRPTRRR